MESCFDACCLLLSGWTNTALVSVASKPTGASIVPPMMYLGSFGMQPLEPLDAVGVGGFSCFWWFLFSPTYMFHLCVLFWSWLATLKLLAVDFLVVLKLDMSSKAFKARTSLDAKDWAPRYTETLYETVLARSLPHSCRLNLFYLNLPLKDAERLSRSVKSISRHK
jgi:hypothetical protein